MNEGGDPDIHNIRRSLNLAKSPGDPEYNDRVNELSSDMSHKGTIGGGERDNLTESRAQTTGKHMEIYKMVYNNHDTVDGKQGIQLLTNYW